MCVPDTRDYMRALTKYQMRPYTNHAKLINTMTRFGDRTYA